MKLLCKMLGGSHAYGVNTPASDTDYRGVFVNTDIAKVIGLDRFEHQDIKAGGADEFYFELRHYLCSLRKTNTQALELLFNKNWLETSPEWELIRANKFKLLDSERLFNSLRGYMHGERRLANGERTGNLGGKRKAALDQWGFSPKNFVQLFRLAWAGQKFFEDGFFPVNVREFEPDLADSLLELKLHPERFNKEDLNRDVDEREAMLVAAYEKTIFRYEFDQNTANQICLEVYGSQIREWLDNGVKS